MTVRAEWSIDQIFDVIRTSFPYCAIQRDLFDRVIAMLCGCYENTRIRELKPRLSIDNEEGRVTARRGVAQLLYANGGTIPNRGLFHMRNARTHEQIGR
jgi:ATP-dependent Lhr-like helicase